MNILISLTNLQIGGAQMFAIQLAYEFANRNHKVIIYSHQADYDVLNLPDVKILSVAKLPFLNFLVWKINSLFSILKIKINFHENINRLYFNWIIKKFNPDIINSHMSFSDSQICKLLERTHKPIVFIPTLHGEYELGLSNEEDIRKLIYYSTALVYTTDKNLTRFNNYSKTKKKIGVGISSTLVNKYLINISRKEIGISDNDFVFGMIARGVPEKGWKNLVECFVKINEKYPSTTLLLIGDGEYLSTILAQYKHPKIHRIQLSHNPMNFLSYIPLIDAGVLPSYFKGESYPNIVIQYIYFEKPVIATNIGEISKMMKWNDAYCGILIDLHNQMLNNAVLYDAMTNIMNRPNYEKFREICRIKKKYFDIKYIADEYEKFFNSLIYDSKRS